jgi:hypothetical protein
LITEKASSAKANPQTLADALRDLISFSHQPDLYPNSNPNHLLIQRAKFFNAPNTINGVSESILHDGITSVRTTGYQSKNPFSQLSNVLYRGLHSLSLSFSIIAIAS